MVDGEMQPCAIANALPLMPMPYPIPIFDGEVQLWAIAILRVGHRAQDIELFGGRRRGAEPPD
jgi:hypothetical protein